LRQAGIGIAMLTLIENTVRVTIRHSDTMQIASEAATAPASLDDATGADGPSKPAAVGDRIMAEFLRCAGRITRNPPRFRKHRRQYCGG
jgi:hypothetical protein